MIKKGIRGVPAFIIGGDLVVGFNKERIEELIDYTIINCSKCNAGLRIPKGKGKLKITCPKCSNEFFHEI